MTLCEYMRTHLHVVVYMHDSTCVYICVCTCFCICVCGAALKMLLVPYNFMARSNPCRDPDLSVPYTSVWTGSNFKFNWMYVVNADRAGHGHLWKVTFFLRARPLTQPFRDGLRYSTNAC